MTTSPDTAPLAGAPPAPQRSLLHRLFDREGALFTAIEKLVQTPPPDAYERVADLRHQLAIVRGYIADQMGRARDYDSVVAFQREAREERAARKAELQIYAGDRDADAPRYIGFDEPAILPVMGD